MVRCSASSTTHSGWTRVRRGPWRSSRAARWPRTAGVHVAAAVLAEPVVFLFGAREPGVQLRGLPELSVVGLPDGEARALLDSTVPVKLNDRVREHIVTGARANPLALVELPRSLSATELAGFGAGSVSALSD